jgi:hypothetical protein
VHAIVARSPPKPGNRQAGVEQGHQGPQRDPDLLGAAEKAKPAIDERAQEGQTFASLSDEWMDGVERSPRSPNSSLSTRRLSSSDETDTEPNAS